MKFPQTVKSIAVITTAFCTWSVSVEAATFTSGEKFLTIGQNFTGSTYRVDSGFIPPDTMGAVGEDSFVELINGRYSVYSKSDGRRTQTSSLNQFWSDAGVTPSGSFAFDPRVVYDPFSKRWFAASTDNAGSDNNFLLAVSKSSDPTVGWTGFALDSDSTNLRWADFPTIGFDRDGVYLAANMFPIADRGGDFRTTIIAVPKNDLIGATPTVANITELGNVISDTTELPMQTVIAPNNAVPENQLQMTVDTTANDQLAAMPTVANATKFENLFLEDTGFTVQPVVDLDNTGLPVPLLSAYSTSGGLLKRSDITGDITSPTLNTSDGFISVTPLNSPPNAEQPGPKQNLSTIDDRFGSNVILQNGAIWGVQSVENNGRSALHWVQIDANTNALLQEGLIADPNLEFYYGSIAINEFDDVVIGFSGSSESQFVSSYAVLGETLSGVTTFDEPLLLKAGVDDYQRLDGSGRNRWGDYSATMVDPTDPLTFWTIQEFVSAQDVWSTQITEVKAVPESSSVLGVLTFGVLGASLLKRRWQLKAQGSSHN